MQDEQVEHVSVSVIALLQFAPVSVAPLKLVPAMSALLKLAFVRFAF